LSRYIANALSKKPKPENRIYKISSDNANIETMRSIPKDTVEKNLLMAFKALSKEVIING